jgi:hypothetical protein
VVGGAAGAGRGFFEVAETGSGFASVEDAALRVGYAFDVCTGEGGYAGEALEKVEDGALAFEEGVGFASHGGDDGVRREGFAIVVMEFEVGDSSSCFVGFVEDGCSGSGQAFAGEEFAFGVAITRYCGFCGYVSGSQVFG